MSHMRPADNGITWDDKPEYKAGNGGMGMCNTGSGERCVCVLGGIGCNVDHVKIARENLKRAFA